MTNGKTIGKVDSIGFTWSYVLNLSIGIWVLGFMIAITGI
jgi:hypothetical protein